MASYYHVIIFGSMVEFCYLEESESRGSALDIAGVPLPEVNNQVSEDLDAEHLGRDGNGRHTLLVGGGFMLLQAEDH